MPFTATGFYSQSRAVRDLTHQRPISPARATPIYAYANNMTSYATGYSGSRNYAKKGHRTSTKDPNPINHQASYPRAADSLDGLVLSSNHHHHRSRSPPHAAAAGGRLTADGYYNESNEGSTIGDEDPRDGMLVANDARQDYLLEDEDLLEGNSNEGLWYRRHLYPASHSTAAIPHRTVSYQNGDDDGLKDPMDDDEEGDDSALAAAFGTDIEVEHIHIHHVHHLPNGRDGAEDTLALEKATEAEYEKHSLSTTDNYMPVRRYYSEEQHQQAQIEDNRGSRSLGYTNSPSLAQSDGVIVIGDDIGKRAASVTITISAPVGSTVVTSAPSSHQPTSEVSPQRPAKLVTESREVQTADAEAIASTPVPKPSPSINISSSSIGLGTEEVRTISVAIGTEEHRYQSTGTGTDNVVAEEAAPAASRPATAVVTITTSIAAVQVGDSAIDTNAHYVDRRVVGHSVAVNTSLQDSSPEEGLRAYQPAMVDILTIKADVSTPPRGRLSPEASSILLSPLDDQRKAQAVALDKRGLLLQQIEHMINESRASQGTAPVHPYTGTTNTSVAALSPVPSTLGSTLISTSSDSEHEYEERFVTGGNIPRRRPMPSVIVSPQPEQLASLRDVYMAHSGSNKRYRELLHSGYSSRGQSFVRHVESRSSSAATYSKHYDGHLSRYITMPDPYYVEASTHQSPSSRAISRNQSAYSLPARPQPTSSSGNVSGRQLPTHVSTLLDDPPHFPRSGSSHSSRPVNVVPAADGYIDVHATSYERHTYERYPRDPSTQHNTPTKEALIDPRYSPERRREAVMVEAALGKPAMREMGLQPKRFAVKNL